MWVEEGHSGRHAASYHEYVLRQLKTATEGLASGSNEFRQAVANTLGSIADEVVSNPDILRGQ